MSVFYFVILFDAGFVTDYCLIINQSIKRQNPQPELVITSGAHAHSTRA